MKYKYLYEWVNTVSFRGITIKAVKVFEDQIFIFFKNETGYLQINLSSEDSFCFFGDKYLIPDEIMKNFSKLENILKHAELNKISQESNDRIISFSWEKKDIYNQKINYRLILELIPRFQNCLLLDENNKIIFAKKNISFAENEQRQILPGLVYQPPETCFINEISSVNYPLSSVNRKIIENSELYPKFDDINELFENIYYNQILFNCNEQKRNNLLKKLRKDIEKKQNKLTKLQTELADTTKSEKWLKYAELLKGNLAEIKPGANEIEVLNYYEPNLPKIIIPLLKEKSPIQNVNYYFKKYRKARDGKIKIQERIVITENEIDELEKEFFNIKEVDNQDFIGFEKKEIRKVKKNTSPRLKSIFVNENWEIFIGRTSRENDFLTTRFAQPHDWWFHTRIFRGTHLILRNYNKKELPQNLKLLCSQVAAYYSKAKKSTNVPVDYTEIRYVRKPRGSAPGFVTYKNQKTLYVDPISMRDAVAEIEKIISNDEGKREEKRI